MMMVPMRVLLLAVLLAVAAHGQSLDEAARALSKKVAARLTPGEYVRIAMRNLTSLPAPDASKAQTAFSRGLRKVGKEVVDVTLTISENIHGYLLVVDVRQGTDHAFEMSPFEVAQAAPAARPVILKSLVWEQDEPILDLAIRGDQMVVLSTATLTRFHRTDAGWQRDQAQPVTAAMSRDPRGQLGEGDAYTILAPVNTFQSEGGNPYYTRAHWKAFDFTAEPDGLVHLYDADHRQVGTIENWGSDVAPIGCGVTATSPVGNGVTVWDVAGRKPRQVSEELDMGAPVTALWPAASGALAIVKNTGAKSRSYAAYILTLDCAH